MKTDAGDATEALRAYRTDCQPNFFTETRARLGIEYEEPRGVCSTLFWPGCALASYSQALTESVYNWLRERGLADAMTARCCGNILAFSAAPHERQDFAATLKGFFTAHGVRRVVTVCPNCFYGLRELMADVLEVRILSDLLFEQGMRLTPELLGARSVAIHDSCPDRRHGVIAASVRSLCEGLEIRELAHNRQHSLCCGLGKLLFITAPAASERLRSGRLREFCDSGAEVLLCYCMSCAQAFQYPARDGANTAGGAGDDGAGDDGAGDDGAGDDGANTADGVGGCGAAHDGANTAAPLRALHYLEPLFDCSVDWAALRTDI